MNVVIHAIYMLNFCNDCDSIIYKKAINLLCQDLKKSIQIDAIGVIKEVLSNSRKIYYNIRD